MGQETRYVEVAGEILRETGMAIQVRFNDDDDVERTEWFSLSQIKKITHAKSSEDDTVITVAEWVYKRKQETWN